MYIHEQKNWPHFTRINDDLFDIITKVSPHSLQGTLLHLLKNFY